ncbi:MAG: proline--tRNA ligase [Oligoflexia bacterium]|nr:proline--tRNA ligase [Oligoflexia bacterium]
MDFVQSGLNSWRDMPLNLYQIQTKYRDEIRPRFGLMRAREFIMKDAYSFDTTRENSLKNYKKMFLAYQNIFNRLGVKFVTAKADSGAIGGSHSEEFHILAKQGEDELLVCKDFSANVEICPRQEPAMDSVLEPKSIEEFATLNIKSIQELAQFLNSAPKDLVKILFFTSQDEDSKNKAFAVLCLGDDEINPLKVKKHLNLQEQPLLANDKTVKEITGANPGSCGPYRLKQQIPIYLDNYLKNKGNFITGANKDGFHLKNVNPNRDFKVKAYGDFCFAREGDLSSTGLPLKKYRGIEVGHLFYLSDEYSKKMSLTYLDKQGKKRFVEMGCYGLGVTRTLQAVIEQSHDEKGIIWPLSIAPFSAHICLIDPDHSEVLKALEELTALFKQNSLDYFTDDRKERPGVKFKDADLIGLPLRINLGARDLQNNQIEIYIRKTNVREKISLKELADKLPSFLSNLQ